MAADVSLQKVFNVSNFRAQVATGFVRNSSFLVDLNLPAGLRAGISGDKLQEYSEVHNKLRFYIESTTLPGIGLATTEIRRYGHGNMTLRPYAPVFADIDIVVRMDAEGKLYEMFQSWLKLVLNTDTSHGLGSADGDLPSVYGLMSATPFEVNYKVDYTSDAYITTFDDEGKTASTTVLVDSYPIYLGPIPVNWADGDSIMKFSVKMAFNQWFNSVVVNSISPNVPIL